MKYELRVSSSDKGTYAEIIEVGGVTQAVTQAVTKVVARTTIPTGENSASLEWTPIEKKPLIRKYVWNWRFLDSQPTLKLLVATSRPAIIGTFAIASVTALWFGSSDLGLPLRVAFFLFTIFYFLLEFNVIWEAMKEPEKGHVVFLGFLTTISAIIAIISTSGLIWQFLSHSLNPVDLTGQLDKISKWVITAGVLILALSVYDDLLWLGSRIKRNRFVFRIIQYVKVRRTKP